jgi:hypothetical protein
VIATRIDPLHFRGMGFVDRSLEGNGPVGHFLPFEFGQVPFVLRLQGGWVQVVGFCVVWSRPPIGGVMSFVRIGIDQSHRSGQGNEKQHGQRQGPGGRFQRPRQE